MTDPQHPKRTASRLFQTLAADGATAAGEQLSLTRKLFVLFITALLFVAAPLAWAGSATGAGDSDEGPQAVLVKSGSDDDEQSGDDDDDDTTKGKDEDTDDSTDEDTSVATGTKSGTGDSDDDTGGGTNTRGKTGEKRDNQTGTETQGKTDRGNKDTGKSTRGETDPGDKTGKTERR